MRPIEGATIISHGQKAVITCVVKSGDLYRCYLDRNIVVPTIEYTRDCIDSREIQRYIIGDEE